MQYLFGYLRLSGIKSTTYTELRIDNVCNAAQHYDEIQNVPRVTEVVLPDYQPKKNKKTPFDL